jgi:hypothetical protein
MRDEFHGSVAFGDGGGRAALGLKSFVISVQKMVPFFRLTQSSRPCLANLIRAARAGAGMGGQAKGGAAPSWHKHRILLICNV